MLLVKLYFLGTKKKYKYLKLKPGFVLSIHTFGRDDKWNVHIHCLLSETILGNNITKKLINSIKLPIIKSLNRWQLLLMRTFNTNPLKCDICNNIMKYERCYNY